mgnify:CR=1 FL=1
MITAEEKESLLNLWNDECEDEWRMNLTEEEAALVAEWDEQYEQGLARMVRDSRSRVPDADGRAIFV